MTRIDELKKKYPTLHPHVIVKLEIVNSGMRDSTDLDKVSHWVPATGSYQTKDHDVTLHDYAAKTPWRVKPGYTLRAPGFHLDSGLGVPIMKNTQSPYQIREVSDGKFALFEEKEKVDVDVYFPKRGSRDQARGVTSRGTPISDLITMMDRRCFKILPVRFCEYFNTREECRFCNFNASQEDGRSIGLGRAVTINPEETVEAYKIVNSEVGFLEGWFESGGFMSGETEGNINLRFVEKIASAAPNKPHLQLTGEAMERKELQRLKDSGLDAVRIQMEVWDERLFPEIVPGKAKHLPREKWLEALCNAVDIYGAGYVAGKFVGGVTLIPENGFSLQEGRDSHIEGNDWCIKNGVLPAFTPLRWAPGSPISRDPANRQKFPPTEYYLDIAVAHHRTSKEYGIYEKLDRFLYCGFDCMHYPYCGEAGILELSGDVGTWMSDVVPEEANWMARFVASVKSSTRTF